VQSVVRLMVRVIKALPIGGEFAVIVSRESGGPKVICAFADGLDAGIFAKAAGGAPGDHPTPILLDGALERRLTELSGPPAKNHSARKPLEVYSSTKALR